MAMAMGVGQEDGQGLLGKRQSRATVTSYMYMWSLTSGGLQSSAICAMQIV